ncbi:unnamed protein product [Durusdinium trenchii]|uniref:Uncharacterized protein n=1 Tax=Durusdinium trenchii TaxID=1381693 RepID=A0ABP0RPT5_9DINO
MSGRQMENTAWQTIFPPRCRPGQGICSCMCLQPSNPCCFAIKSMPSVSLLQSVPACLAGLVLLFRVQIRRRGWRRVREGRTIRWGSHRSLEASSAPSARRSCGRREDAPPKAAEEVVQKLQAIGSRHLGTRLSHVECMVFAFGR